MHATSSLYGLLSRQVYFFGILNANSFISSGVLPFMFKGASFASCGVLVKMVVFVLVLAIR
jgi:hypothetical protein